MEGDKVLFCGSDVAKALGYARPNEAIAHHCKGTVKRRTPTDGGEQEMLFIPEGDLYRLVFSSRLPEAERFTDWVTDEVLPSIRQHGAYMTPETIEQVLLNPNFIIKLATQLKEEQAARQEAEAQLEINAPKVLFAQHCKGAVKRRTPTR